MTPLDELRRRYPWPGECPDVPTAMKGDRPEGWCSGDNRTMFERLGKNAKIIVELGSWLGLSASYLLDLCPQATVICVDHWRGSAEHHRREDWKVRLATLYETFLRHHWANRDRIVPMRTGTLDGLQELRELGIQPDLIYVDASHDEESVYQDITACLHHFPEAEIIGDDWLHASVRRGVIRAADHLWLRVEGINCWHIPLDKRGEHPR